LPPQFGKVGWILASSLRIPEATAFALLCAWSAVVISLWIAVLDALGSVVVLFLGAGAIGATGSIISFSSHTAGGLTFLAIFVALGLGFVAGFLNSYATSTTASAEVAAALLAGIVIAFALTWLLTALEPLVLEWRGYRRPSRREWERSLQPAMHEIAAAMKVPSFPTILVADTPVPNAWAHSRHVVVTTGLIAGLDHAELTAVIAHEVMHWRQEDPLALRVIWSLGWPIVLLYTVGMWLSGAQFGPSAQAQALAASQPHVDAGSVVRGSRSVVAVIGWLFLWPSWLLIRLVIVPSIAAGSRQLEYEADAGAAAAGFGQSLHQALERLAPFEGGRSAWEAVLSATHPPMELRLEALDYVEYEPPHPVQASGQQILWIVVAVVVLLVIAVVPMITTAVHP
jgi:Zn-dependent protease with chaperone function